jgi:hypothetical protein
MKPGGRGLWRAARDEMAGCKGRRKLFVKHRFIAPMAAGQLELATERRSLRPAAGCPMPELTAAVFGETRVSARVVQNQKTARVARPWRARRRPAGCII